MNPLDPPRQTSPTVTGGGTAPSFRRRWLRLGQALWIAFTGLAIGLSVAGISARFAEIHQMCADLRPNLPITFCATYILGTELAVALSFFAAACVIFWYKPGTGVALLLAITLVAIGATEPGMTDALIKRYPTWNWPVLMLRALAVICTLSLFYLFPDGRFVPRWTRVLAVGWCISTVVWLLFPGVPFNTIYGDTWRKTPLASVVVALAWFGSGLFAQILRYRHVSDPFQRLQTKWTALGLLFLFLSGVVYYALPVLTPTPAPGLPSTLYLLGKSSLATFLLILAPACIAVAVLWYRLWHREVMVGRALVYSTLTIFYIGIMSMFQTLVITFLGRQPDLALIGAVAASVLTIVILFHVGRSHLQTVIDRYFYPQHTDFRPVLASFSRELDLLTDISAMVDALFERVTAQIPQVSGAIFRCNDDIVFSIATSNVPDTEFQPLLDSRLLMQLQPDVVISRPLDPTFPLIVPLPGPRRDGIGLVGVLALGVRPHRQRYSHEDQDRLIQLAQIAGMAIGARQLVETGRTLERQEAQRRNSSIGKAEALAQQLLNEPVPAFADLHRLAADAAQDPSTASVLTVLPQMLHTVGASRLANVAEGFRYLVDSASKPEMLTAGLRELIATLALPGTETWRGAADALSGYRQCLLVLEVASIADILALVPDLQTLRLGAPLAPGAGDSVVEAHGAGTYAGPLSPDDREDFLPGLSAALGNLLEVASALQAYERVAAAHDKLECLAQALVALRIYDAQIVPTVLLPERHILNRVIHIWTACVTDTSRNVQSRANLQVDLITRQVVAATDRVTIGFTIFNVGLGPATNVDVELAPGEGYIPINVLPGDGYEVMSGRVIAERMVPGRLIQVEVAVRLTHDTSITPRFVIQYDDVEQVQHIQSVSPTIKVLAVPETYVELLNPYAAGMPLRPNSPIFFGREDTIAFIRDAVGHPEGRQMLVLTGQRRMGKTSLLKQLPDRLGATCVPVYINGETLGHDGGMPTFFYQLALDVADALNLEAPTPDVFLLRPGIAFEREFLPRMLQAAGDRRLVFLIDEFEWLELRVQRGKLDADIFPYLRHLMQHGEHLSFIFVGTHTLQELNHALWLPFLNVAHHRRLTFLEPDAARELICTPLQGRLVFDDLAVNKMLRLTAGHPYFLQLLCYSLVEQAQQSRRNYVVLDHVDRACRQVLEAGDANFVDLWQASGLNERLVLVGLARMPLLADHATSDAVVDYLASRSVTLPQRDGAEALQRLVVRGILKTAGTNDDTGMYETYRWQLGIFGIWIAQTQSLGRLGTELHDLVLPR